MFDHEFAMKRRVLIAEVAKAAVARYLKHGR
jgi:hypothetical protein